MKTNLPQEYIDIVQQKRKITVEEYLQLPETNQHVELIDGELIVYDFYVGIPPLKDNHHKTVSHLMYFLSQYIPANQLRAIPCDVFLNPYTVVQPDVFWVNPQNHQLMRQGGYEAGKTFISYTLNINVDVSALLG